MTDHLTPTDDDLSLALDGEADAALLARIEADPDARARLEQLRAATGRLRNVAVAPLEDDTVDDLIAAAIDTPIAPSRPASGRGRSAVPWLVAAAVIVLMAIGLTLVWAGQSSDQDQAGATKSSETGPQDANADAGSSADAAFSAEESTTGSELALSGGHGAAPTTSAPAAGSPTAEPPVLYLGSYPSAAKLREATASSFADAWKASGSPLTFDSADPDPKVAPSARTAERPPSDASIDRCGDQLQVTLSMKAPPIQAGYATVDDQPVLVYEFAATSARSGEKTTLVAAVGLDACDEVVIFER